MPSPSKKHFFRSRFIRICILLAIFSLVLFFFLLYSANILSIKPSHVSPITSQLSTVQKVIDGDTVDVLIDGKKERVRLIGIDAPEMAYEEKQADCFANQATEALKTMINGNTVSLVSDPTQSDRDEYNRLLRYIFLPEERLVNSIMVSEGYAREYTYKGIPYQYQKEFQVAELDARNKKLGLWADGAYK